MSNPVWITNSGSIGSVLYLEAFEKTLIAQDAVNYTLVAGSLPIGVTLSSNGIIAGIPDVENIVSSTYYYNYTFTVRAQNSLGNTTDRTFSLTILLNLYVPNETQQSRVRYSANTVEYTVYKNRTYLTNSRTWKLDQGSTPSTLTLTNNGTISAVFNQNILPLSREQFVSTSDTRSSASQESWNQWLNEFLSGTKEYDYQFTIAVSETNSPITQSFTVRLIYTKILPTESWITNNVGNISYNQNQYYFLLVVSDANYINWITDSELADMINGSISELAVEAVSNQKSILSYNFKPQYISTVPQGLILLTNGLLVGRISFRCHQDDPTVPVNDDYTFTVRATSDDTLNFSEKTFNVHVNRVYERPYQNTWIRSFPSKSHRDFIKGILDNQNYFPTSLLYRNDDPWFGKNTVPFRFLFAPGLNTASIEDFYQVVSENHYDKILTFSEVKTAVCLDKNLQTKYEVVYLEIQDRLSIFDKSLNVFSGLPDIIDIREFAENYYIKNNVAYYIFRPNGLTNMNNRLKSVIGYYNSGILPDWMLSLQPIQNDPLRFRGPTGFIPAVVLAFTKPGGSELIKYRLNSDRVNFNEYEFKFDRYELDTSQSKLFDGNTYTSGTETIMDFGSTIFENGGTTFIDDEQITIGDSKYGDKYVIFPKIGAFY